MLTKFKNFRKDIKETLNLGKEEKSALFVSTFLNLISSVISSIFPLFMAIGVSIFTEHKLLGLVLIIMNLTSSVISESIGMISQLNNQKLNALDLKNSEKFVGKILTKTRGKVIFEENGVKQNMSTNNMTEVLKAHYSYIYGFLMDLVKVGIQIVTAFVSLFAVIKTIPAGKEFIFFGITFAYLIIYIIAMLKERKYRNDGYKELSKFYCSQNDAVMDIINIEPISNKHSDFLFDRTVDMLTRRQKVDFRVNNKISIISLIVSTVYMAFTVALVLYLVLSVSSVEDLAIEQIIYAISITQILNSLVSGVTGLIGHYKTILESIDSNKLNESLYAEIIKVYHNERELKKFKGNQITLKPFKFKYPTGEFELKSPKTITFKRGDMTLLKDDSGVGKSTLMKLTCGDLGEIQDYHINKVVYFNDRSDLGTANLLQEITFAKSKEDVNFKLLNEILTNLKLADLNLEKEYKTTISNGMRQRILLARALYNLDDVDLICMDEPIGSLDEANAKDVIKFVKEFCNRDKKRFIVICSHQYEIISNLIDNEYRIIKTQNKSVIDG